MTNRSGKSEYRTNRNNSNKRRLYKNPDKAKICGVCAGLSEYFDLETWVVRLIAVSLLLFTGGGGAVIAYFVACFIMEPKPGSVSNKGCFGKEKHRKTEKNAEERQYHASVKDVWKKGAAPSDTIQTLEISFDKMESKLQSIESYVTSNKYQLEKEFEKMA